MPEFFRQRTSSAETTAQGHSTNQESQGERSRQSPTSPTSLDQVSTFQNKPMVAGRLRFYSKNWSKYTTNKEILQTVQGIKIEFHEKPCQLYIPTELRLNAKESTGISNEIHRLLNLGVVVPSENETSQFVSTVFARSKKDGKYRMILNLSKLN